MYWPEAAALRKLALTAAVKIYLNRLKASLDERNNEVTHRILTEEGCELGGLKCRYDSASGYQPVGTAPRQNAYR